MGTPRQKTGAVIVAAGLGKRIGGRVPKQFLEIRGKPILLYTLDVFEDCHRVDVIVLVVPGNQISVVESTVKEGGYHKVASVVEGGVERQDSVWNGLDALPEDMEWIAVHDGVRPFVSRDLVESVLDAAKESGAALPAVPVKDTIKRVDDNWVVETLDRHELWRVQTPQVFRKALLMEVYRKACEDDVMATDDAALIERYGGRVKIVMGDEKNIKITSPEDLEMAETFLRGTDS